MDTLVDSIPKSFTSIVGLAVILFLLRIIWTFAEEWSKTLYKTIRGGKEKRHEARPDYNGFERRANNDELQHMVSNVLEALTHNTETMQEFVLAWKTSTVNMAESIEEIKRKQDNNWKRLFSEDLPRTCKSQ